MSSSSDCFSRSSVSCSFASACRRRASLSLYFAPILSSRSEATDLLPRPRRTGAAMISPLPPLVGEISSSSSSTRAARLQSEVGDTASCPSASHVGGTSSSSSGMLPVPCVGLARLLPVPCVGLAWTESQTSCPSSSGVGDTSSSSSVVSAEGLGVTASVASNSSSARVVRLARSFRMISALSLLVEETSSSSSSMRASHLRSANGCAWLGLLVSSRSGVGIKLQAYSMAWLGSGHFPLELRRCVGSGAGAELGY